MTDVILQLYRDRTMCNPLDSDGSCIVDKARRNWCPHCRLKKCFSVGMNTAGRQKSDTLKRNVFLSIHVELDNLITNCVTAKFYVTDQNKLMLYFFVNRNTFTMRFEFFDIYFSISISMLFLFLKSLAFMISNQNDNNYL